MRKYAIKPNLYHLYHLHFLCEHLVWAIHSLNMQNGTNWNNGGSHPDKFRDFDRASLILEGFLLALQLKYSIDKTKEAITITDFKDKVIYTFDWDNPILSDIDDVALKLSSAGW